MKTYGDTDVREMYWELSVGGHQLNNREKGFVRAIRHEDNANGSDVLTITIQDPDFIYLDNGAIFIEDQPVHFKGGWVDEVDIEFSGYVNVIDINFPNDGTPTLALHCMDETHKLNRKKNKKTWKKKKHSQVATEIFKKHGLKAKVDDTGTVHDTVTQSDTTDIDFLIDLAGKQKENYLVYVEGGVGYFIKKPVLSKPQMELIYRTFPYDIQSFNPRINKEQKQEEVEKSDVDDKTGKKVKAKADSSTPRETQGTPTKTSSSKTGGGGSKKSSGKKMEYKGGGKWVQK